MSSLGVSSTCADLSRNDHCKHIIVLCSRLVSLDLFQTLGNGEQRKETLFTKMNLHSQIIISGRALSVDGGAGALQELSTVQYLEKSTPISAYFVRIFGKASAGKLCGVCARIKPPSNTGLPCPINVAQ